MEKIFGICNATEGESRGGDRKIIIRVFIFNFITINEVIKM